MDKSYFIREWVNHYLHEGYDLITAKRMAQEKWQEQMDIAWR